MNEDIQEQTPTEAPAEAPAPPKQSRRQYWVLIAMCIIVAAGLAAYYNSFSGPFIFCDETSIVGNPHVRWLQPMRDVMSIPPGEIITTIRPVLNLSLAANYSLAANFSDSGLDVRSWHAFNLAVHILAGLALLGIVRRTLLTEKLKDRFKGAATPLALVCAAIWLVHPLQTSAVTYIIQRAESMAGLFYLLTLYFAIRGIGSKRGLWWYLAAIVACALGMGTKEVVVTAPLVVLLYDRVFISQSFKESLRRRWGLYAGLAATWGILGGLVYAGVCRDRQGIRDWMTPVPYARTQCDVIVHYLKLSFWPDKLVLDYAWPPSNSFTQVAPNAAALLMLLITTILLLYRRAGLGFLARFFLMLAPSSSVIPVKEAAVEGRMYLPLAAVVSIVVFCAYAIARRITGWFGETDGKWAIAVIVLPLAVAAVLALGYTTISRNEVYRNEVDIWQDTVDKRPENAVANNYLGKSLINARRASEAVPYLSEALKLVPKYLLAHHNLGLALARQGKFDQAIPHYQRAVELEPGYAEAYNNLGNAFIELDRLDEAAASFYKALNTNRRIERELAHFNLGMILLMQKKYKQSTVHSSLAFRLNPKNFLALNNLGIALSRLGRLDEAIACFRRAVQLKPDSSDARYNLEGALKARAKLEQEKAPQTQPN